MCPSFLSQLITVARSVLFFLQFCSARRLLSVPRAFRQLLRSFLIGGEAAAAVRLRPLLSFCSLADFLRLPLLLSRRSSPFFFFFFFSCSSLVFFFLVLTLLADTDWRLIWA